MQDQPTLEAIRLLSQTELIGLTGADYRRLKSLADQASEDARLEIWPQIWGDFARYFDAR